MKSSLTHENFKATFCGSFVFFDAASSCILNTFGSGRLAKCEFTPAILFGLNHALLTPSGVNNAQLLRDSEPIRLLENVFQTKMCFSKVVVFSLKTGVICRRVNWSQRKTMYL